MPPEVLLLASPVRDWMAEIDPSEQVLVKNAVLRRRAEFSTGRLLASLALAELGLPPQPIARGPMNEPVWPEGVTGSITHTQEICMVALAANSEIQGIGIDLESRREEFKDIGRMILRPDEQSPTNAGIAPEIDSVRLVFSAKEALYKAVSARIGRFVDFQEVRTEFRAQTSRYTATAPEDPGLDALIRGGSGRIVETGDLVFAFWGNDRNAVNLVR